jgi:hypothetical protein
MGVLVDPADKGAQQKTEGQHEGYIEDGEVGGLGLKVEDIHNDFPVFFFGFPVIRLAVSDAETDRFDFFLIESIFNKIDEDDGKQEDEKR